MANTLYLECNSGISGDMTVAALLDLGASEEVLMRALDSIPADGFSVEVTRVKKAGIDCCDFAVLLDADHENHDHDMEYLHGCPHEDGHEHTPTRLPMPTRVAVDTINVCKTDRALFFSFFLPRTAPTISLKRRTGSTRVRMVK